ncbi:hypothetical protein [Flammeovirga kamogawensis]|uniref:Secreted protein n=1 Tax=Flammeovirga kamogawensis TaxID=373891 RepID=A0ABX8GTZ0_9BACT|nr:hypothetical protein [Flammeovirga kamogawensis]MBB6459882.1 hypothetical protein [Flammeovirga kamogawensis]QWG07065.1 hypothetical protein KM029_17450 [Flammeovirga kamogawensis]TRX68886.1 hypothetical protein EO216_12440 [Flammeovirga kamogawensis]
MQENKYISFKLFPFMMAIVILSALFAETVYAVTIDATVTTTVATATEDDADQGSTQKATFDVLKEQSNALPQSTEGIQWCNVFVKTLPPTENFRLILKPNDNIKPNGHQQDAPISAHKSCVFGLYAAPNAP